ncbi:helix-turn-helix domain-containing protein [Nocardia aobensis]|uniref:helix-turn-helix domain-containing protein n=1 Tax=Nocardia aobensis TaxID=257277 RepID=UPI000684ECF6|nr:helix-turn-helix domain-containing protein [Nocardia aobensis]
MRERITAIHARAPGHIDPAAVSAMDSHLVGGDHQLPPRFTQRFLTARFTTWLTSLVRGVSVSSSADTVAVTDSAGSEAAGLDGLSASQRQQAMTRFTVLRPYLEAGIPLAQAATAAEVPVRTARRWLAAYRRDGLPGLVRKPAPARGSGSFLSRWCS